MVYSIWAHASDSFTAYVVQTNATNTYTAERTSDSSWPDPPAIDNLPET
ncbi:MAG: hypothetical protein JRC92_04060 [Deltaproteobacteria bacterium]|nr:hypothetical protein [Deltaproteobacteria bacterium]